MPTVTKTTPPPFVAKSAIPASSPKKVAPKKKAKPAAKKVAITREAVSSMIYAGKHKEAEEMGLKLDALLARS